MDIPNDPTFWEKIKSLSKIPAILLRHVRGGVMVEIKFRNEVEARAVAEALQHFSGAQIARAAENGAAEERPPDEAARFAREELRQPKAAFFKGDVTFTKKQPNGTWKLGLDATKLTAPVRRWCDQQTRGLALHNRDVDRSVFRQRVVAASRAKTAAERMAASKIADLYLTAIGVV